MMKTAVKTDLESKTFFVSESYTDLLKKEKTVFNLKFYQKLFILIISFSTILIFPESPRELANICESYNFRKSCNVW